MLNVNISHTHVKNWKINLIFFFFFQICLSADIVIEIPGNLGQDDSSYRLDYYPPYGNPLPNTTIASRDVGDEIQFSNVLAGTKYNFWLYYTNATHHNLLAWTVSITTGIICYLLCITIRLNYFNYMYFYRCLWYSKIYDNIRVYIRCQTDSI